MNRKDTYLDSCVIDHIFHVDGLRSSIVNSIVS